MIERLFFQITQFKWLVVIYAVIAVAFCLFIYFKTRKFEWNKRTVAYYAILFDLDDRSRVAFALALGRIALIAFFAITRTCSSIVELIVIEAMTLLLIVFSGSYKAILQVLSYLGVFAILFLEKMFFDYYIDMGNNTLDLIITILFGVFALQYSILQFFTFLEQLLDRSFHRDLKKFNEKKHVEVNAGVKIQDETNNLI